MRVAVGRAGYPEPMPDAPDGFRPLADAGAFADLVGPLHVGPDDVLGVRVEERHLNRAGTAMGGFLATLVDAALGRAVRAEADGDATTATVSLTTDYLRPARAGAWLEARTAVERMGGRLAFADCSVTADGREAVRARAVLAVRAGGEG
jgi:acyl-coenzyme A thioesterase 13